MYIVDLSDQTFRNLSSPEDISISSVAAYYRFGVNLGKLNSLIGKAYSIDNTSLEIVESDGTLIGIDEAAIYEILYTLDYYDRQIRRYLGAGGVDVMILESASSDGGNLKFTNRNNVAKSFLDLKKDFIKKLDKTLNYYKFGKSRGIQVVGDDTIVINTSARLSSINITE